MRNGCTPINNKKFDVNIANDGDSVKASPFHELKVLGGNDCPYWLVL